MAQIYISVGSNIEPEKYTRIAAEQLQAVFGELTLSSVYLSEAVGFNGNDFLNLVVGAQTDLSIDEVVAVFKRIEVDNGRKPTAIKFSARTLDLDLLLYDDVVCQSPVRLPRAEITFNAFVLWPLAEIAPDLMHPEVNKSYQQLWRDYDKTSQTLKPIDFKWKL
ncbi:MAG: 2-amino-4-hydroxy-6-hydroxymethyldihydropteridine diphosphokinase [Parashewanella sp.]